MSSNGFVKRRANAPEGFYAVEAAGLAWLGEVPGGAQIVRALDLSDESLTVELIEEQAPSLGAAVTLGHGLARMHAAGAAAYGCPPGAWTGNGFIGPLPLAHQAFDTFGEFFATVRILPFVRDLRDAGTLEPNEVAVLERVCDRLVRGAIGRPGRTAEPGAR